MKKRMYNMAEFSIREMEYKDIDAVMAIDRTAFLSPWSREIFEQELIENKFANYFVIEEANNVVGYVGLWFVEDDAQITNIALLPKYRGYKIDEKLFGYSFRYAIKMGASRLSQEVCETNILEHKLCLKFGLVPDGIRKVYYPDNKEN